MPLTDWPNHHQTGKTTRWPNHGSILGQRLGRWSNIDPWLNHCVSSDGHFVIPRCIRQSNHVQDALWGLLVFVALWLAPLGTRTDHRTRISPVLPPLNRSFHHSGILSTSGVVSCKSTAGCRSNAGRCTDFISLNSTTFQQEM